MLRIKSSLAGKGGNMPAAGNGPAMKAYQRLIRERTGVAADVSLDIRAAEVRLISYDDAKAVIVAHESSTTRVIH
jgi:hypothetical protein